MPALQALRSRFGTSTGAIIAALIALGHEVDEIHALYKEHVPTIMKMKGREGKSQALQQLGIKIFGDKKFDTVKQASGSLPRSGSLNAP